MKSVLRTLAAAVLIAVAAPVAATADSAPPGATARCTDGSYSFAVHHSGACSHHGGVAAWLDGNGTVGTGAPQTPAVATPPATANPAAVIVGRTVLLARRTRSSGCVRGILPDRRCSPGAYYSGLTAAILCSASFRTGTVRNVPQSEKYTVEREYGMPARSYGRTIEIDHIVSLELGGSNDPANLYPEPGSGRANFHSKDVLENATRSLVCQGRMSLRAAQVAISANWVDLYRKVFHHAP